MAQLSCRMASGQTIEAPIRGETNRAVPLPNSRTNSIVIRSARTRATEQTGYRRGARRFLIYPAVIVVARKKRSEPARSGPLKGTRFVREKKKKKWKRHEQLGGWFFEKGAERRGGWCVDGKCSLKVLSPGRVTALFCARGSSDPRAGPFPRAWAARMPLLRARFPARRGRFCAPPLESPGSLVSGPKKWLKRNSGAGGGWRERGANFSLFGRKWDVAYLQKS